MLFHLQKDDRLGWVGKARLQLNELENRFLAEIAELPMDERRARRLVFDQLKSERLTQLNQLEDVQPTVARLIGWAHVDGGAIADQLGYEPNAEKLAISTVVAELESVGFHVDDRQTAGVGYDLLARHRQTGERRCVEVKGFSQGLGPVWLEQNEWAQALQRRDDYWLYVVDSCATEPTVRVRVKDPVGEFGAGARQIQRFQIKVSQLRTWAL